MISRRDMADDLALGTRSAMRTYIVESNADNLDECLRSLTSDVQPTEDVHLFHVQASSSEFWVDRLDPRFWRFHTKVKAEQSYRALRDWVGSRQDVDWMWLPSQHLSGMWPGARPRRAYSAFIGAGMVGEDAQAQDVRVQATGRDAERLLERIKTLEEYRSAISLDGVEVDIDDPNQGTVREAVRRMGAFSATGDDLALHLRFVSGVVARYRRLVETCELKAISWETGPTGSGAIVRGGPILIRFSRRIDDLEAFADELTSCTEPFRLWGTSNTSGEVVEIEAVDLHVGQRLQFDIAHGWMRVYLRNGCCGNTVARLISNLQHRFDADLTVADPEIAKAIGMSPSAAQVIA